MNNNKNVIASYTRLWGDNVRVFLFVDCKDKMLWPSLCANTSNYLVDHVRLGGWHSTTSMYPRCHYSVFWCILLCLFSFF